MQTKTAEGADVAIIGGGPAGSALAIRLADRGLSSIVVERTAEPAWRACGVFSSPLSARQLIELGLATTTVKALFRPISALNLETTGGVTCRLTYEHGHACGFDRPRLDAALLERAQEVGVDVRTATVVRGVELPRRRGEPAHLTLSPTSVQGPGESRVIQARVVVGAGGAGYIVPGSGAQSSRRLGSIWRSGMTFHRPDVDAVAEGEAMEGRFVFGTRWYAGIAPVPGGRVNIGMVFPGKRLRDAPASIAESLIGQFPGSRPAWADLSNTDDYRISGVLNHGVDRLCGDGWLLVGDAIGFIDPLTGEGIHRAFVSAEIAAEAIARGLRGDPIALRDYDRRIRSRFRSKDVVSWVLQAFLSQPRAFDYALRRLARRTRERKALTLVLTDQHRATAALDPRYLWRLLAP
jgi:flavin-dependent dehydrogenase